MIRRLRHLAGVLAAAAVLTACSPGADDPGDARRKVQDATDTAPSRFQTYAALGDSFTAGPLVPTTDLAGGCFRSDHNYPSLVAEQLDVKRFSDVSCSGADTSDLTGRQPTVQGASVPPQLRAVRPGTDLVTLGIGGNDFDLFETLVSTCSQVSRHGQTGSPCADTLQARGVDLVAEAARISTPVSDAVREVQRRAPKAKVVLVGYLRLAPADGRCRLLPFARGDYAFGDRVTRALNDALARAARRTDVAFVDMYAASAGHDICSDDPWVNGATTEQGKALAFHPLAEGMEAVADEVVKTLSRQGSDS
jgi:lysophospholipase L1-like esterase